MLKMGPTISPLRRGLRRAAEMNLPLVAEVGRLWPEEPISGEIGYGKFPSAARLTKAIDFLPLGLAVLLILALTPLAQGQTGLIGHWKLDEGVVGGIVADATAGSLDGRAEGFDAATAAANSVPGKIGRAVRFSGAGSIQLDKHAPVLGKLTDFTLSMWIQYDGGASRLLFTFSDGTLSHRIQVEVHNGALSFGWQDGGSWQNVITKPLAWEPGRWYHVVFVNDSKAGKSILRSNDLVCKTHSNTLSPAGLRSPVKRVEIGSLNGGYPYNGCIDDVRLFDSPLPLSEQLALYDASKGEPDDPQWAAAKTAMIEKHRRLEMARQARELFYAEEAPHLTKQELQQKTEWLFQTEEDDLLTRTGKEIVWTREMIDRLQNRADAARPVRRVGRIETNRTKRFLHRGGARCFQNTNALFRYPGPETQRDAQYPEIDFSRLSASTPPTRTVAPTRTERSTKRNGSTRAGSEARCAPRTARSCSCWRILRTRRHRAKSPRPTTSRPAGRDVQFRPVLRRSPGPVLHEAGRRAGVSPLRNRARRLRNRLPAGHLRRLQRYRPDLPARRPLPVPLNPGGGLRPMRDVGAQLHPNPSAMRTARTSTSSPPARNRSSRPRCSTTAASFRLAGSTSTSSPIGSNRSGRCAPTARGPPRSGGIRPSIRITWAKRDRYPAPRR